MKILGTDLWVNISDGKLMRLVDGQWVEVAHDGVRHLVFKNQSFTSFIINKPEEIMSRLQQFMNEMVQSRHNNSNPEHPQVCVVGSVDYNALIGELKIMLDGIGYKEASRVDEKNLELWGVKIFKSGNHDHGFYFGYL